jgi:hypothetical protein
MSVSDISYELGWYNKQEFARAIQYPGILVGDVDPKLREKTIQYWKFQVMGKDRGIYRTER